MKTLDPRKRHLLFNLPTLAIALGFSVGCKSTPTSDSSAQKTQSSDPGAAAEISPRSAEGIKDLSPQEFQALHDKKGGTLLDVRTPSEVAQGRIKGASVVDSRDPKFKAKLNSIQKDKPIFVYCRSGGRSGRAAKTLQQLGFKEIYNLDGGIGAWQGAQLPVESSSVPEKSSGSTKMSLADFDAQLAKHPIALVNFHTEWCTPCLEMAPIVDKIAKKFEGKAAVLRIDVDSSEALSQREKALGVPVFVLYEKGKETWRHSGIITEEELSSKIEGK